MRIPRKYDPSSGLRPDRNARSVNPGADRGSAAPNICKASPWRTRGPATTADCRTTAALRQKQSGLPPDRNRGQAARYRRHMDGRRSRPQRIRGSGKLRYGEDNCIRRELRPHYMRFRHPADDGKQSTATSETLRGGKPASTPQPTEDPVREPAAATVPRTTPFRFKGYYPCRRTLILSMRCPSISSTVNRTP